MLGVQLSQHQRALLRGMLCDQRILFLGSVAAWKRSYTLGQSAGALLHMCRLVNNLKEHHTFKFDGIFEPGCTQEQVGDSKAAALKKLVVRNLSAKQQSQTSCLFRLRKCFERRMKAVTAAEGL